MSKGPEVERNIVSLRKRKGNTGPGIHGPRLVVEGNAADVEVWRQVMQVLESHEDSGLYPRPEV